MVISPLPLSAISGWLRLTACQNVQVRDNVWEEMGMLRFNILGDSSSAALSLFILDINICASPYLISLYFFFLNRSSFCTVKGNSMDTLVKIRAESQNTSHSL